MRRPLVYLFIALIAGIVCGYYYDFRGSLYVFFALLSLSIIFFSFSLHKKTPEIALALMFLLIFFTGFLNIQKSQYHLKSNDHIYHYLAAGKQLYEGMVTDNPVSDDKRSVFIIRVTRIKQDDGYLSARGYLRLVAPSYVNLQYGDYIRFSASLRQINEFHNPGGFNYARYMNMKGIFATAFISNESQIILLRKNSGNSLKLKLEKYRYYLQDLLNNHSSTPAKEIIAAMTLGKKRDISAEVRENFNRTGTAHLLAISGLHIGMVFMAGFFVISFLLRRFEFVLLRFNILKVASAFALIFVLLYAFIAGLGITVIRATLMALVFLIAFLFGRQKDIYNILALAGIIILLFLPEALFDISFQLSFSAVFSIIYIFPRLNNIPFHFTDNWPTWLQYVFRKAYSLVVVCLAASIGTMPLIAYYFYRISTVAIFANLFAVVLLGMISLSLSMGFIISASFSSHLAALFIKSSSFFVEASVKLIEKFASFTWSSFTLTRPSFLEIFVFYLFIFFLFQMFDRRWGASRKKSCFIGGHHFTKIALSICIGFFICNTVYLFARDKFSDSLRITVIDVGQGSSILVRYPHGKNMLIDGGGFAQGSFDVGKMVIAPFLYAQRIAKIHTVVLTHPHPDHLQGLIYITEHFNVDEAWSTGQPAEDEMYQQWKRIIAQKNIKTKIIHAQSPPLNINGVSLEVLWPPSPPAYAANDYNYQKVNDDSLVIKLIYGKRSVLLTSDISSLAEQRLIEGQAGLNSDVLLVPHHGSHYSSSPAFIDAASCRFAIISTGKNNLFRHPHVSTLRRYADANVKIYRTDQSGAIFITTDGANLRVEPYLKTR